MRWLSLLSLLKVQERGADGLSGDVVTVAFFGARMPSEGDRMVWHRRLGHLHDRGMQALLQSPAIGLQYTKGFL